LLSPFYKCCFFGPKGYGLIRKLIIFREKAKRFAGLPCEEPERCLGSISLVSACAAGDDVVVVLRAVRYLIPEGFQNGGSGFISGTQASRKNCSAIHVREPVYLNRMTTAVSAYSLQ
jgi:hypothetical protein